MNKSSVFHSDPEILSGTVVFKGTRVPLQNLIDYLEGGYTLDEFLDDFPSVTRERAIQGLEEAAQSSDRDGRVKILLDECLPRRLACSLPAMTCGPFAR